MEHNHFIDIGVNYGGHKYTDDKISKELTNFKNNGGKSVISISNFPTEIARNVALSNSSFDCDIYFTAGCHPHNAKNLRNYSLIENSLSNPKCLCVGEMGLDYNRMFSPKDIQITVFEKQIEIAKRFNKPMYMHCRDAFDDFIMCLDKFKYYNGVIHCFTGSRHEALELVNRGFKLGITGWLLDERRNSELLQAIQSVDIESLMIETDAPFMSLKNEKYSQPKNVITISNKIAQLKNIDQNECANILYETTRNFFSI